MVFLLSFAGCSKKSTSPDEQPADDYSLLATETIGPDGGSLETSEFFLTVPPGAFGSSVELKLYGSSQDRPYGDFGVSKTFQLEGLPESYYDSLRVAVKYQDTLSNVSFVAVGQEIFDPAFNGWEYCYHLLDAVDSSGWLIGELPSETMGTEENGSGGGIFYKDNANEDVFWRLLGVSKFDTLTSVRDHFEIIYPTIWQSSAYHLASCLEKAYDTLLAMGFEYKDRSTIGPAPVITYPIKVELKSNMREDFPGSASLHRVIMGPTVTSGWFSIRFNELYMGTADPSRLCVAAGRAFFELVPKMYIVSSLWLDWSVSLWIGEKFCQNPPYVPAGFEDYEMVPFGGIKHAVSYHHAFMAAAESDEKLEVRRMLDAYFYFSGGLTPIIKHLIDEYGGGIISDMYEEISASHEQDDVQVLVGNVPQSPSDWWPDFFKKYVGGEIYGVESDVFMQNNSGELSLSQKHDTTFTEKYPDLSARLFWVHLDDPDLDEDASIDFRVSSTGVNSTDLAVLVFGLKSNSLSFFQQDREKVTLAGVKALMQQGYSKLAAVVVDSRLQSPYTDDQDVDLNVSLGKHYGLWMNFSFGGDERHSYPDKPDEIAPESFNISVAPVAQGDLSGNSFSLSWSDEQHQYFVGSGSVTITFSSDTTLVTHLDLSNTEEWSSFTRQTELTAANIQRVYSPEYPNDLIFTVEGEQTCSYFNVTKHQSDYDNGEVLRYEPGSCECILTSCSLIIWLTAQGR